METSPCCNSVTGDQIATNFCTCHDSTAVVPCTKFCSDHCIGIEMRAKRNFHRIWIAMEKPLVKRGPVQWRYSVASGRCPKHVDVLPTDGGANDALINTFRASCRTARMISRSKKTPGDGTDRLRQVRRTSWALNLQGVRNISARIILNKYRSSWGVEIFGDHKLTPC